MRSHTPIALTLGDPAGVGPEIVARALCRRDRSMPPLRVFGSTSVLAHALDRFGRADAATAEFIDTGTPEDWRPGQPSAACGRAAIAAIEAAVAACRSGECAALVTAPINKTSLHLTGCPFPGHTEMLAALCHLDPAEDVAMMFASPLLNVVLATIHCSLSDAIAKIRQPVVERAIRFAHHAGPLVTPQSTEFPRIAVAGLNPHAGEGGLFGDEEDRHIAPAVAACARAGILVSGPHPPDTVFMRARRGEFDVVVAMTHDHGLIAVKLDGLEQAVNVTLGLPFLRTSVDHGTAFDIAWQGRASAANLESVLSWTQARL